MKPADELIESEIPLQTRVLLPRIFQRAYQAADQLVEENRILQCPSAQIGHLRAWASDAALEQAMKSGEFPVEGYEWVWYTKPTGQFLQIYTKKALLTVNQLADITMRPRDAKFRENAGYHNEPFLFPELDVPMKSTGRPHLILAHGYQSLSFIHIGMPNPEPHGAVWLGITKNILGEIHIVSSDAAPIEAQDIKPIVTIKEAIKEKMPNMVTEFNQSIGRLIPARLREVREAARLNMTELAEKVGVTVASISQYESDDKQPEWETMMRICAELKQPVSYFTSPRPPGGKKQSPVFFRSFKSKTKATHKMLNQWRSWSGQLAVYIGNFVNLPAIELPEFQAKDSYTDDEIENFAKECRRFWGLGEGPIANLVALFESKGIIVIRAKFGVENVDAFSCWQDDRPFIFLGSDKASSARSRFDAAHELGHLLLHANLTEDQIENPSILERIEHEANRFASAFLLPARTFCAEVFSASLKHFEQLKRRWKVSIAAMIYRCKDLEIFDEYQYVNLRKQLSYHKMLKREPLDDEMELERTSLFEKSLELLINKGIKKASDFLSVMMLNPEVISSIGNLQKSIFEEEADSGIIIQLNLK